MRGVAPWLVGSTSVPARSRHASTSASHNRAPWSRGSRPSWAQSVLPQAPARSVAFPPHSVVGCGAARGKRELLIHAASSMVPRPRIRTPPRPSSTRDRCRPAWAERASRSAARSSRRSAPSGSSRSSTCLPTASSSEASRVRASSMRRASAASRSPARTGSRSIARTITSACGREIRPAAIACPTATLSVLTAAARDTVALPAPFRPPVTAVRKSCVEPQPSTFTPSVASSSATTCSYGVERRPQPLDLAKGLQKLLGRPRSPEHIGQVAHGLPEHAEHRRGRHRGGEPGVCHELTLPASTDISSSSRPFSNRCSRSLRRAALRCSLCVWGMPSAMRASAPSPTITCTGGCPWRN